MIKSLSLLPDYFLLCVCGCDVSACLLAMAAMPVYFPAIVDSSL